MRHHVLDISISILVPEEKDKVDTLLWEVLWKPLGFPREAGEAFKLEKKELIFIAKSNSREIGAVVGYPVADDEWELRHIAVKQTCQKSGVGRKLVEQLENRAKKRGAVSIRTIARNTSSAFFMKLGFKKVDDYPDHPEFIKHGISFILMQKSLIEN